MSFWSQNVSTNRWRHVLLLLVSVLMLVALGACGSSTPTLPAASPTAISGQPPSSAGQPGASSVPSSSTQSTTGVPGSSASSAPTEAPTKFASAAATETPVATHTPTKAASASGSSASVSVKPAALGGRIAYGVFLGGDDFSARTIFVATLGSNVPGGQIIARAAWPAYSPDGAKIAYFHWSDGLYIANSNGTGAIGPLIISPGVCCIDWSRDGAWIAYADSPRPSQPGGPIKMLKVDGAYKTIVELNVSGNGVSFSPDGKHIVFSGCLPNTNTCGVLTAPTDGSGKIQTLTTENGGNGNWSPDGKRIVYQSTDANGHRQVFVMNADGTGIKQLTNGKSNDGQPVWSRDGGTILWRSDQNGTAWAIYAMNADGTNPRKVVDNAPPFPNLWGWDSMTLAP